VTDSQQVPSRAYGRACRWVAIGFVPLLLFCGLRVTSAEPVALIRDNGDTANRLDIVILGDGYTASQLDQYADAVESFVSALFAQEPLKEYQRYFNVHRIDVASVETGADHPERTPPIFKNTALGATYNCAGIQRLICVDVATVNAVVAASVPPDSRDVVLVLVNDAEYGGSGGAVAVASVHRDVVELILHELGHSFGLLADEYGGPPPPFCNATIEPPEPNATRQTQRELIKWAIWVDPDTPIPTLGVSVGEPGLYEGAKYCDTGLFRPTHNSKMRSLNQPYEQINSEQLVKRVYNFVSPIDSADPTDSIISLRDGQSQTFRVETPQPLTHALEIVWHIDGQPTATGNEFTSKSADVSPGSHLLEVTVSDPTSFVRNDPAQVLSETRVWDVSVIVSVAAPDLIATALSNPPASAVAGRKFTVTDTVRNVGTAAAGVSRTNYFLSVDASPDVADRRLIGSRKVPDLAPSQESTGTRIVHIPGNMNPGTYFLLACADQKNVAAERDEGNNCKVSATQVTIEPRRSAKGHRESPR
jgi:IgA Peptidase M64/CARDB